MNVSVYIDYSNAGDAPLEQIISEIRNGRYRKQVEKARTQLMSGDSKGFLRLKKRIPAFVATGVINGSHKDKNLTEYNGVVILNIDKLDKDKLVNVCQESMAIPYTHVCFISPSNQGLKIIVKHDAGKELHYEASNQIADFYENELDVEVDRTGFNLARLSYFSYDPSIHYNIDSESFHVKPRFQDTNLQKLIIPLSELKYKEEFIRGYLKTRKIKDYNENRNGFVFSFALNCKRESIPVESSLKVINLNFGYDKRKVERTVINAYELISHANDDENENRNHLFSINLINYLNYKEGTPCETRVFFEYILKLYIFYNREFYKTNDEVQNEIGIGRRVRQRVTKDFVNMKFLKVRVENGFANGHPTKITFYDIVPRYVYAASKELMKDATEFNMRIKYLLERKNSRLGYGGWSKS